MIDPTRRQLQTLEPTTRSVARAVINALRSIGIPAIIVADGARRTFARQRQLVAAGRSKTMRSHHLAGAAFDLDVLGWNRDDIPVEFWKAVGPWVERETGFKWGGRFGDWAHFEAP